MAGKGGGGAWKVAYADFVTAMMAFFLVMWICGQDQQLRRAVSHYFNDPFNTSMVGTSKKPTRSGSVAELNNTGNVPQSESIALGRGRQTYSFQGMSSPITKQVSDWVQADEETRTTWRNKGQRAREAASRNKEVLDKTSSVEEVATRYLAKQLKDELTREIPPQIKGVYQDLILEALSRVNWQQLAEDLMVQ